MILRDVQAVCDLLRGIVERCPNHSGVIIPPNIHNDEKGTGVRRMTETEMGIIAALLAAPPHLGGYKHNLEDADERFEYFLRGWVSCKGCRMQDIFGEECACAARRKRNLGTVSSMKKKRFNLQRSPVDTGRKRGEVVQ